MTITKNPVQERQRMLYSGIDLHKKFSVITTMDSTGTIVARQKVVNQPQFLLQYFNNLNDSYTHTADGVPSTGIVHKAVIEATFGWGWIADLLEQSKIQVMLAHPQKTKAIASARIKTDTVDATTLAHLLRSDMVAPAHYSNSEMREKQELLRSRARLMMTRSQIKNKVYSILHKHNLNPEWDGKDFSDMFGKAGRAWLKQKTQSMPPYSQFALDNILITIDHLSSQIKVFDKMIVSVWEQDETAVMLRQLPGFGPYSSLLLSSEIGSIERFPTPDKLCSYAGLVPSVYQSADKCRMGKIKQGNKYIRWILIEAVPKAIKKDKYLFAFYSRIAAKKGNKKAKVATARKMLAQIHLILTSKQMLYQGSGTPAFFSDKGTDSI